MKKGLITTMIGAAAYCAGAVFLPWQRYELAQLEVTALEVHWLTIVFIVMALALCGVAGWGLATGRRVTAARAVIVGGLGLVAWVVVAQLNREWGTSLMSLEQVTMSLGFVVALAGALLAFGGGATALARAPRWDEATPVLRVRATSSDATQVPREVIIYEPREVDLARELGLTIDGVAAVRFTPECEVRMQVATATRVAIEGEGWRAREHVVLGIGDRARVDLGALELRFDYVRQARQSTRRLVLGSEAVGFAFVVLLVFLALGVGTIIGWEEDGTRLLPDQERRTATIAALTEDERKQDEPEAVAVDIALLERADASKAAGGVEGLFGSPDAPPQIKTKVPPQEGRPVERAPRDIAKTGILDVLTDPNKSVALTELLSNDGAFAARVQWATSGNDDSWAVGPGSNGLSFDGDGDGGPGNGPGGRLLEQGTVDTGRPGTAILPQREPKDRRKVPTVTPGPPTLGGDFCNKADIASKVARRASIIRACYEQRLQVVDGLKGKVTARWTIGLDGKVSGANAITDTLGDSTTTGCVLRAVQNIKFNPPSGGMCVVQWPFVFNPG